MHDRIHCLANIFPRGNHLIDIGSDHGYLGLILLKKSKALSVCNVELSKSSLKQSEETYKVAGLSELTDFVYSDGFKSLKQIRPGSVVVISGLGSAQILKILEDLPDSIKHIILLSHTDYLPIRQWAQENFWNIEKEKYVVERKIVYIAMSLIKTSFSSLEKYSFRECILGKEKFYKYNPKEFENYWAVRTSRILRIPYQYRTEADREVISFLIESGVIKA